MFTMFCSICGSFAIVDDIIKTTNRVGSRLVDSKTEYSAILEHGQFSEFYTPVYNSETGKTRYFSITFLQAKNTVLRKRNAVLEEMGVGYFFLDWPEKDSDKNFEGVFYTPSKCLLLLVLSVVSTVVLWSETRKEIDTYNSVRSRNTVR